MRNAEQSGQSAEHDSYHGDMDPGFGAGLGAFVVADQSAVTHEPAEGALDDPSLGQDLESLGWFVTNVYPSIEPLADPFNRGASIARIGGKGFNGKMLIYRLHTDSNPFRRIGAIRGMDDHGQQIAEDIGSDMAFTAFDFFFPHQCRVLRWHIGF